MGYRHKPNSISLTLSGNEITDLVRATGTEGDGLTAPAGIGVWEATENLVPNGGFETNTTGVNQKEGTETITRRTDGAKFGSGYGRCVTPNGASSEGCFIQVNVSNTVVYTFSVWLKGSGTVKLQIRDSTGPAFTDSGTITLDGTWTRYSLTVTAAGDGAFQNRIVTTSQQVATIDFDGFQVEVQPIATPYVETDGGTATRSAARVQIPVAGLFTETQGWVVSRLRMGWANTDDLGAPANLYYVLFWQDSAANHIALYYDSGNNVWVGIRRNGAGAQLETPADTFSRDDLKTIVFAWDATTVNVSIDGGVFTSTAGTVRQPTLTATSSEIGSNQGANGHIDSNFLWAAFGAGTLTDADAATIDAAGSSPEEAASVLLGLGETANPTAFYNGVNGDVDTIIRSKWPARLRERS